ncbi:MAG: protein translocase subunit SecD [Gemmatimonadetes bacterium]|nr:MAG: protein translocase subunit SecD [Gemmatimonadota bacterium]
MIKSLRGRILVILSLCAVSIGYLVTNKIKLGLDLQGGMHLVLEVDDPDGTMTDEARADAIDRAERILRTRIDEFGVEEPLIQKVGTQRLIVELPGVRDQERAKQLIQQSAFLEFRLVHPVTDLAPALPRLDRQIVAALGEDALREMGRDTQGPTQDVQDLLFGGADSAAAADSSGAAADSAASDTTAVSTLRPFTGLLTTGDREGVYLVAEEDVEIASRFMELPEFKRALPRGVELFWEAEPTAIGARNYRRLYVLDSNAFLTGDRLESAVAQRDPQFNQAQVNFELDRRGGRIFGNFTAQHVGDYIAIVLDGEVMSAPEVRDRIGSSGVIEMGNADLTEAADLALVLRAGALPAPLKILEERTVGPSLGADSIEEGEVAGVIGLVLVVLIMVGYYRVAGFLSVLALAVYVLLVMGGLSALNATLTLPGIAGLILSIGMAVDANVLIFERIREELALGRATRTAVDEGFGNALSAIVDANLTTLITALILFQFGTGPVRGFAVTLSIGIVASFFSAIYVTRTFFLLYLSGKKASDPISI